MILTGIIFGVNFNISNGCVAKSYEGKNNPVVIAILILVWLVWHYPILARVDSDNPLYYQLRLHFSSRGVITTIYTR